MWSGIGTSGLRVQPAGVSRLEEAGAHFANGPEASCEARVRKTEAVCQGPSFFLSQSLLELSVNICGVNFTIHKWINEGLTEQVSLACWDDFPKKTARRQPCVATTGHVSGAQWPPGTLLGPVELPRVSRSPRQWGEAGEAPGWGRVGLPY